MFSNVIEAVKNLAVIVTMIAAIFAILVNWKAIFRPQAKQLEDKQFEAAINLISAVSNPQLQFLYNSPSPLEKDIAFGIAQPLLEALLSPFLPERLRVEGERLWQTIVRESGVFWIATVSGIGDQSGLVIRNKESLLEQHKLVYNAALKWLHLAPRSFPFTVSPKQS